MKARPYAHTPFKSLVIAVIRSTAVDADTVRRAYDALAPDDRACMPWVPHLLRLEAM